MKKTILLFLIILGCVKVINAQSGNLDSTFGTNGVIKSNLGADYNYELISKQVLLQSNGSMYVILLSVGKTLITKKLSNGAADSSYGLNGLSVLTTVSPVYAAVQSDGKVVVAGVPADGTGPSALVRYNADGSTDNTFSADGVQAVDITVTSITVQSDGKIVAVGMINDNGNSYFAVGRYNADGSADLSFSNDGIQTTDFGFSQATGSGGQFPEADMASAVTIQANGKIVAAGSAYNYADNTKDFALARFNSDGSIDSTFSTDGRQTTHFGSDAYGYAVTLQKDGKIVLAGYANPNGFYSLAVARYNTNGSPDTNFDLDGRLTTNINSTDNYLNSVAMQSDGKILVEGVSWNGSDNDFTIVRYNTNGSLDVNFASGGKLITDFGATDDYINSLAVQPDGKIIAGGYAYNYSNNSNSGFVMARYNANGTSDLSFNKTGKLTENLHQGYTVYNSTAIQTDGKIITTGYTWTGSNYNFVTARYNVSGSLDKSFGRGGVVSTNFGNSDCFASSAAIQSNGKIIVAGEVWNGSNNDFAVARYNTNGSLDSTFGTGGRLTADLSANDDFASAVIIQPDEKIVVAGYLNSGTESNVDFVLARYKPNGKPDSTFGTYGSQTTDFNLSNDFAYSAALQNDGKIVVAGYTGTGTENNADFALVRYNSNGSVDTSFNGNGRQTTDFDLADDYLNSIAIQSDGKIVAGGHTGNYGIYRFALTRYNTNGSLDNKFNGSGKKATDFGFSDVSVNAVAVQGDGKIIIGGSSGSEFAVARFNTGGSADTTFNKRGIQIMSVSAGENAIKSIAIKNDRLYAAGYGEYPGNFGVVTALLLGSIPAPPAVSITSPANNTNYLAPATVKITAAASDADGTIASVKFYNNGSYLKTVYTKPYTYTLSNLSSGTYSLTAKATDNTGLQTISAPVKVTVTNNPPVVSITAPAKDTAFFTNATVKITADASDADGTIASVKLYINTNYFKTVFKSPYTFTISGLAAGNYSFTAKATDNSGNQTVSAPVNVTVTSQKPVGGSGLYVENGNITSKDALSLRLSPDPASDVVNIYAPSLQQNKAATVSIISLSGSVVKTMRISAALTRLDVSALAGGVYTLKVISGDRILYKQFVKL